MKNLLNIFKEHTNAVIISISTVALIALIIIVISNLSVSSGAESQSSTETSNSSTVSLYEVSITPNRSSAPASSGEYSSEASSASESSEIVSDSVSQVSSRTSASVPASPQSSQPVINLPVAGNESSKNTTTSTATSQAATPKPQSSQPVVVSKPASSSPANTAVNTDNLSFDSAVVSPSGVKVNKSDWVNPSNNVPQELYSYDLTKSPKDGFCMTPQESYEIDQMYGIENSTYTNAAKKILEYVFNMSYTDVQKNRTAIYDKLREYCGDSGAHKPQYNTYLDMLVADKATVQCSFTTDSSLVYANAATVVRGRIRMKVSATGNTFINEFKIPSKDKWYYKDIEVFVTTNGSIYKLGSLFLEPAWIQYGDIPGFVSLSNWIAE